MAKIGQLTGKDGLNVYPGTIPQAVIDPSTKKNLRTELDEMNEKFSSVLFYENVSASVWVSDTSVNGYSYRCDLGCAGVLPTDFPDVVFSAEDAVSGNYSPVCESKSDAVSIWSKTNKSTVVPTIKITR